MAGYPTSPEGAEFAILGVDVMIPGFDDVPSSRASGEPTGTGLVLVVSACLLRKRAGFGRWEGSRGVP